jgi:hypothetical protein
MPSFVVSRVAGVILVGLAGASASAACSSNSASPGLVPATQTQVCPVTTTDTVGKPCSSEGLLCAPQYMCGEAPATLSCVCRGGAFQCTDGTGSPVTEASDGSGPCPGATPPPGPCPASEGAANHAACTSLGQICAYRSALCQDAIDQCVCFPSQTSTGRSANIFTCDRAICAPDASVPPPPVDAGSDAPAVADAAEEAPAVVDADPSLDANPDAAD